jgi:hypothetical protein
MAEFVTPPSESTAPVDATTKGSAVTDSQTEKTQDELTQDELTPEFLTQFEMNSREFFDLRRALRSAWVKLCLFAFLIICGGIIFGLSIVFSLTYIQEQFRVNTFGPLYDFGISLAIYLALLVCIVFIIYLFVQSLLKVLDDIEEMNTLIHREREILDEMSPFIEGSATDG